MDKQNLIKRIMADPQNASYTARNIKPVFQIGSKVKLLIISQAPGLKVEQSGIVFTDKSGDRLRDWLGINSQTFYKSGLIGVLPMDAYYPGKAKTGDLPPRKEFAPKWHPQILSMMPDIQMTLLIGNYAQKFYLKDSKTLTQRVEDFEQYLPKYFPLPHPSPLNNIWLKKNPWFESDVIPNLKNEVSRILK
ncbi:MAG: uracil-DNA glycosylase family protein [Lactobacillaceae bacterium]|jgi:uracil-DNA glycosylase|nr:uracil-DNA glycosylase family protein [Lactobacillaceae bacterium]